MRKEIRIMNDLLDYVQNITKEDYESLYEEAKSYGSDYAGSLILKDTYGPLDLNEAEVRVESRGDAYTPVPPAYDQDHYNLDFPQEMTTITQHDLDTSTRAA